MSINSSGIRRVTTFGLLFKPRPNLKFGCLAQNLEGYGLQWLTLGTAYRYGVYQFSMDVAFPTDRTTPEMYIGIEWDRFPIIPIRVGFSNGAWTLGTGVAWKGIRIDYAEFLRNPPHQISSPPNSDFRLLSAEL